jgi:subtilisin family serine protease
MKTILVTGGAGFIGSHACNALSRAGYDDGNGIVQHSPYRANAVRPPQQYRRLGVGYDSKHLRRSAGRGRTAKLSVCPGADTAGARQQRPICPEKLKLLDAHRLASGNKVLVAVIDSEVDANHPDLVGAITASFEASADDERPHSHGTGMAGAIAAHRTMLSTAPRVGLLSFAKKPPWRRNLAHIICSIVVCGCARSSPVVTALSFVAMNGISIEVGGPAVAVPYRDGNASTEAQGAGARGLSAGDCCHLAEAMFRSGGG